MALLWTLTGCSSEPDLEIRKYSVPKTEAVFAENHVKKRNTTEPDGGRSDADPPRVAAKGPKQRMLGAIVPDGNRMVFFKLTVPADEAGDLPEKFVQFLATVDFKEGRPSWKLPEGWRQLPDDSPRNAGGGFPRMATILVDPNNEQRELAVSSLRSPGNTEQFILANVNRWRQLLGVPQVTLKDLYTDPDDTEAVQEVRKRKFDNGRTVILVSLVGHQQSGGMGRPPFAR